MEPDIKIVGPWESLVTVVCEDGIERAIEWYGPARIGAPIASHRAEAILKRGKYKGARAWVCIGNYGTCINDKEPPTSEIEDDDEPEPEAPAPAVTLDKWGIE